MNDNPNNDNGTTEVERCIDANKASKGQSGNTGNIFVDTMKEGMDKMFSGMKMMVVIATAALCAMSGCKSVPTPEKIEAVAKLTGTSAAMVVNMTKIDEKSKTVILEIMDKVAEVVPQTNQTFTEVWTPIAEEYVNKLVEEKKIDEGQGQLIVSGFSIVCNGIDYIFDVRYPKAKQYKELVEAAVHGFIDGYKSISISVGLKSAAAKTAYDTKAYDYLKTKAGL